MKRREKKVKITRADIPSRPLTPDEEVHLVARVQKVLEKHVPEWLREYPLTAEGHGKGKGDDNMWWE